MSGGGSAPARLRSDSTLQHAFGRQTCAEYSLVQNTFDACTTESVEELRGVVTSLLTVTATGGQSPYTFTWTNADAISGPNDPGNSAYVYAYVRATVTMQSADGQTQSQSYYFQPYCSGGEVLPEPTRHLGGARRAVGVRRAPRALWKACTGICCR